MNIILETCTHKLFPLCWKSESFMSNWKLNRTFYDKIRVVDKMQNKRFVIKNIKA